MFLLSTLFQVLSPNLLPPVKGVASEEQRNRVFRQHWHHDSSHWWITQPRVENDNNVWQRHSWWSWKLNGIRWTESPKLRVCCKWNVRKTWQWERRQKSRTGVIMGPVFTSAFAHICKRAHILIYSPSPLTLTSQSVGKMWKQCRLFYCSCIKMGKNIDTPTKNGASFLSLCQSQPRSGIHALVFQNYILHPFIWAWNTVQPHVTPNLISVWEGGQARVNASMSF